MAAITLILQCIALACFFISWMNWQIPSTKPLNWMVGGFFFLLLSFMLGSASVSLHTVR